MLDATLSLMTDLLQHVANLAPTPTPENPTTTPDIPDPGDGAAPPFGTAFIWLLKWAFWMALAACVLGVIIIGARMGINHSRGEASGHLGSLGIVGFAIIIIVGAFTFVTTVAGLG